MCKIIDFYTREEIRPKPKGFERKPRSASVTVDQLIYLLKVVRKVYLDINDNIC